MYSSGSDEVLLITWENTLPDDELTIDVPLGPCLAIASVPQEIIEGLWPQALGYTSCRVTQE